MTIVATPEGSVELSIMTNSAVVPRPSGQGRAAVHEAGDAVATEAVSMALRQVPVAERGALGGAGIPAISRG